MLLQDIANKNYPELLVKNREMIEGNIIACLYANPTLLNEYKELQSSDFATTDGLFYYELSFQLYKAGYKVFDAVTINTYLSTNGELKKMFDNRGGYRTIQELISIIKLDNRDIYYDNLVKSNILLKLHNDGFNVIKDIKKFEQMNSEQVYKYFSHNLNDIFVKKQLGVKINDLIIDDAFLDNCNSGDAMGISYATACPILSYYTAGVHKKNIYLIAGFSGTGKTSKAIHSYILPILEQGKKIVIVANEQTIEEYKRLLLGTVLSTRIDYYKMDRKKLQRGGFSTEDWDAIKKAQEYINNFAGKLKFVELFDYKISTIEKIVKKVSKEGFEVVLYDTYKATDLSESNVWGSMVEDSKQLLQLAKGEDVAIILTMQLAINMIKERYLTALCLSTSKGVKEVVSDMILMRKLMVDEYTGEKKDVKPFTFHKDEEGKYTKTKTFKTTSPDKTYMVVFLDKTRSGESDIQLLYEVDLRYNKWKEMGFCTVQPY